MINTVPMSGEGKSARGGRPTKYLPAYCNEVIETMATGLSLTAFAGEIGVSRDTVNEWQRQHPEFSDAVKVAKAKRTKALEQQMLSFENGPAVTARIFALKNADPEEWREKQHIEHNVSGDLAALIAARRAKVTGLNGGGDGE